MIKHFDRLDKNLEPGVRVLFERQTAKWPGHIGEHAIWVSKDDRFALVLPGVGVIKSLSYDQVFKDGQGWMKDHDPLDPIPGVM